MTTRTIMTLIGALLLCAELPSGLRAAAPASGVVPITLTDNPISAVATVNGVFTTMYLYPGPLDGRVVLRQLELNAAIKHYEKVLTAKYDAQLADLQHRLGPPDIALTADQRQEWEQRLQSSQKSFNVMLEQVRAEILALSTEDTKAPATPPLPKQKMP